jgi:peroxiredoxin
MKNPTLLLAGLVGAALAAQPQRADADAVVGKAAPDFTLEDTHGNPATLSSYRGKFVVLEWINYDCPFVGKHYGSGHMQKLQKTYGDKGVVWLGVNSSAPGKQGHYTPDKWNALTLEKGGAAKAILLDADGKVGRAYGAKTTPHMFVIDPAGVLLYNGAIDDKPSTDKADIATARNYVQEALDAAMAGKPVPTAATQPYGCSVKY